MLTARVKKVRCPTTSSLTLHPKSESMKSRRSAVVVFSLTVLAAAGLVARSLCNSTGTSLPAVCAAQPDKKTPTVAKARPPADNKACYVCHLTLKTEHVTTIHLAEDIGCVDCHGPSRDHMQDEMLMTTPDLLHGRREVDHMCGECHEDPHEEVQDEVTRFRDKWRGKERPNGRAVSATSICTDCHGTHNIDKELKPESDKPVSEWIDIFSGEDLKGWQAAGEATWAVKRGRIVGTPGTGGGVLWTKAEYEDYRLAVTFRTDWPTHAGIYLRATDEDRGPRIEVFQRNAPLAYAGSVGLPGKGILLANPRRDLFDPEGWNTIAAEIRDDRLQIWLNGEEIGAARTVGPTKGRIGVYLKGGADYRSAEITIGEIRLRDLPREATDRN